MKILLILLISFVFGQDSTTSDLWITNDATISVWEPPTSFVFYAENNAIVTVTDSMFARFTEEEVMNFAVLYLTFYNSWDMGKDVTFAFFNRETTVSYAKFSTTLVKKLLPEWVFED